MTGFGERESFVPRDMPRLLDGVRRGLRLEVANNLAATEARAASEAFLAGDPMLLWVSPDMCELAGDAAATLPELHFGRDLWPAPTGLVGLGMPVSMAGFSDDGWRGEVQVVRAIAWAPHENQITIHLLEDFDTWAAEIADQRGEDRESFVAGFRNDIMERAGGHPRVAPLAVARYPVDRAIHPDDPDETAEDASAGVFLSALWLLMSQDGITTKRIERADKKAARRAQRAGHAPPDVRIIEIRSETAREAVAAGHDDSETGREYRHRWVVRGHWRRQWVPSLGLHRPTFIAPYVKGPEGAPLLTGQKVHTFQGR